MVFARDFRFSESSVTLPPSGEREREREREKENTRRPRRCLEKRREEERELFVFISPDDDDDDDRRIELTKLTEETSDELELELWSGRESSSEA